MGLIPRIAYMTIRHYVSWKASTVSGPEQTSLRITNMMSASLVITTKNRCNDLRRALTSAMRQTAALEVIVIDDGSEDNTSEVVRDEFPEAKLIRHEESGGYVLRRNEGAAMATGDVIFSIDDDAEFSTPDNIEQTLADFDDPRIGAVAIPFINVEQSSDVLQKARDDVATYCIRSFIGTAHAVRREVFNQVGGYRTAIFHQGEERDLCIRILNAGFFVRSGRASPILHYESPNRDRRRMHIYGRRNDILFAWWNVPLTYLPGQLVVTTIKGMLHATKTKRVLPHMWGFVRGYTEILRYFSERSPVTNDTYQMYRKLKRQIPLNEIV